MAITVETRFNEVPRDRGNFFRYIEGSLLYIKHLHDLMNFRANRGEVNN